MRCQQIMGLLPTSIECHGTLCVICKHFTCNLLNLSYIVQITCTHYFILPSSLFTKQRNGNCSCIQNRQQFGILAPLLPLVMVMDTLGIRVESAKASIACCMLDRDEGNQPSDHVSHDGVTSFMIRIREEREHIISLCLLSL